METDNNRECWVDSSVCFNHYLDRKDGSAIRHECNNWQDAVSLREMYDNQGYETSGFFIVHSKTTLDGFMEFLERKYK
jgi:hypothetical protein